MTLRHNLRRPEPNIPSDHQTSFVDRFLNVVETAWGIGLIVWTLIVFLLLGAFLCAVIMAGPSLLVQLFGWIGTLILGAGQAVLQNPLLLITYPLALFLIFLVLWVPSALDARRNAGHQRGRKVLTAADARQAAARHLNRTNQSPTRKPRRK